MFGLFYILGTAIGGFGSWLLGSVRNEEGKYIGRKLQEGGKNSVGLYVDRRGITRLLSTGEGVCIECSPFTGDMFLCYEGGVRKPSVNLSEKWRDQYYEYIKKHPIPNRTVINDIYIKPHLSIRDFTWQYKFTEISSKL